jgi:hypothetical protein
LLANVSEKKKANEEKDVLEIHAKDLKSKIVDQENSIKDLKQRSCMNIEENKESVQRKGYEDTGRKPALNVSHIKLEETERDQGEPGQMVAPSITEEKPMTEVVNESDPDPTDEEPGTYKDSPATRPVQKVSDFIFSRKNR